MVDRQEIVLVAQSSEKHLYQQVADHMQELIAQGTLQTGDRLPSVRKLHQQLSVSISTVMEAYRLLEDRGLIVARPQSGYYVKATVKSKPPHSSHPPQQASLVDTSLVSRIYNDLDIPDIVKLGAAVPSPELLPLATLNRLMGQVIRTHPEIAHSYHVPIGDESLRHEIAKN